MLAKGLEPSTVRLQGGCSTIELSQQNCEVELISKNSVSIQQLILSRTYITGFLGSSICSFVLGTKEGRDF